MFKRIVILLGLFILVACGDSQSTNSYISEAQLAKSEQSTPASAESLADKQSLSSADDNKINTNQPIIIKTGEIRFVTENVQQTEKAVLKIIEEYQAYPSYSKNQGELNNQRFQLEIRVPAKNFEALAEQISTLAKNINYKNIQQQDITIEFLDIKARLKSKKHLMTRYEELIKKAQNTADLIAIEKEINQLQTEIESIQGQINYLSSQVSMSTLLVVFYENNPRKQSSFFTEIIDGFSSGFNLLKNTLLFIIIIWPYILAVIIGVYLWKKMRNKRWKK